MVWTLGLHATSTAISPGARGEVPDAQLQPCIMHKSPSERVRLVSSESWRGRVTPREMFVSSPSSDCYSEMRGAASCAQLSPSPLTVLQRSSSRGCLPSRHLPLGRGSSPPKKPGPVFFFFSLDCPSLPRFPSSALAQLNKQQHLHVTQNSIELLYLTTDSLKMLNIDLRLTLQQTRIN